MFGCLWWIWLTFGRLWLNSFDIKVGIKLTFGKCPTWGILCTEPFKDANIDAKLHESIFSFKRKEFLTWHSWHRKICCVSAATTPNIFYHLKIFSLTTCWFCLALLVHFGFSFRNIYFCWYRLISSYTDECHVLLWFIRKFKNIKVTFTLTNMDHQYQSLVQDHFLFLVLPAAIYPNTGMDVSFPDLVSCCLCDYLFLASIKLWISTFFYRCVQFSIFILCCCTNNQEIWILRILLLVYGAV